MKLIILNNENEVAKKTAQIIGDKIKEKPRTNLGLATGSTPIKTYEYLVKMHNEEGLSFKNVITYNLDEYCSLDQYNINSYRYFMNQHLFSKINIKKDNTHFPDEDNFDVYDSLINSCGGIDLQLLGIGVNAHIGFNEPSDAFSLYTSHVNLSESTIKENSRFFDTIDEVPKTAITMGIGTIMKAKKIVLIACGEKKEDAIFHLIKGPIMPKYPASVLLLHPDLTIIVDNKAARKLKNMEEKCKIT